MLSKEVLSFGTLEGSLLRTFEEVGALITERPTKAVGLGHRREKLAEHTRPPPDGLVRPRPAAARREFGIRGSGVRYERSRAAACRERAGVFIRALRTFDRATESSGAGASEEVAIMWIGVGRV